MLAAIVGVFAFGYAITGSHPYVGVLVMAVSVLDGLFELSTSPVVTHKLSIKGRCAAAMVLCGVFPWATWPQLKAMVYPPSLLGVRAFVSIGYPKGQNIGGLIWKEGFQDVRLSVDGLSEYPIQNLDLTAQVLDKSGDLLGGMGQICSTPH